MRPIIFRGKLKDEEQADFFDNWFDGDLIHYGDGSVWVRQQETGQELEIIPETVGQYIGKFDSVTIYEGSLLRSINHFEGKKPVYNTHIVEWSDKFHGWIAKNTGNIGLGYSQGDCQLFVYLKNCKFELIGNVHDNKNLING